MRIMKDVNNNIIDAKVSEKKTNNVVDKDLSCPVFHWPQHSFLIEHFRGNNSDVCEDLRQQLELLDIYTKEEATSSVSGKISSAARTCGIAARRRIWFTFDVFLARNRPGLVSDPETGIKKKKRKRSKKKKTSSDTTEETCENVKMLKDAEIEIESPVRAI